MIFAGIVNDVLSYFFLVTKYPLVVLEGSKVAVHHLGVVSDTNLDILIAIKKLS